MFVTICFPNEVTLKFVVVGTPWYFRVSIALERRQRVSGESRKFHSAETEA